VEARLSKIEVTAGGCRSGDPLSLYCTSYLFSVAIGDGEVELDTVI
jgi:hypothetical protein